MAKQEYLLTKQKQAAWVDKNPLRDFRLGHTPKVTIAQVAAACGVSLFTIQKWEQGTLPNPESMEKLKRILGEDVERKWLRWMKQRPMIQ